MSAPSEQIPVMTGEVILASEVSKALAEFDVFTAGIGMLAEKYEKVVFDVTTKEGMEAAKEARAAIRDPRYKIEHLRKRVKAPILEAGKKVDGKAEELTLRLKTIEDAVDSQIKAEEQRIEDEKQAKIQAELDRVTAHTTKIDEIKKLAFSLHLAKTGAEEIRAKAAELAKLDASAFEEFEVTAKDAIKSAILDLANMADAAASRAQEEARLDVIREQQRKEQEELNKRRAEQDELDRQIEQRRKDQQKALDQEAAYSESLQFILDSIEGAGNCSLVADLQRYLIAVEGISVTADRVGPSMVEKLNKSKASGITQIRARIAKVQDDLRADEARRQQARADELRVQEEQRQRELAERTQQEMQARQALNAKSKPTKAKFLADTATHFDVTEETVVKWIKSYRI